MPMIANGESLHITTAMINGKEIYYDACADVGESELFKNDSFKFIGNGTICKINNIHQSGTTEHSFFIRI